MHCTISEVKLYANYAICRISFEYDKIEHF
jgi:hypothetical protein